jgi:thiol:disulfide interchange protein DsbD
MQALIYGLGIIFTFTGLGFTLAIVFGASGLNRFAADPWLNIAVTTMFVAFAFSLFGVWEMALPSSWLTAASKADSGKSRLVGTLLMGLAFTRVVHLHRAVPRHAARRAAQGTAVTAGGHAGVLLGLRAPVLILAIVPQAVASLPRSGRGCSR